MAFIVVTRDRPDGDAQHVERVAPSDFETDHFRTCLSERLAWAVEDAEHAVRRDEAERGPGDEPEHRPGDVPGPVLANV